MAAKYIFRLSKIIYGMPNIDGCDGII